MNLLLANLYKCSAWAITIAIFLFAFIQRDLFASCPESATLWGCAIGLAAFFAWLAVEEEEALARVF